MSEEIWRDIPGYEGHYQVSNFGNVKRIDNIKDRLLKPYANGYGYLQVALCTNNKRKPRYVHTLVLEAFVGPRPDGLDVCHKDGNRQNNRLDNLRYDTHKNNLIDAVKQRTIGGQKLCEDDVREIRELLNDNSLTMTDISTMYNVSIEHIYNIKAHRLWGWLDED